MDAKKLALTKQNYKSTLFEMHALATTYARAIEFL